METLPRLPGFIFSDCESPLRDDHKLKQRLKIRNGFRMISDDFVWDESVDKLPAYDPTQTYGQPRRRNRTRFLPHYVIFDNKCLSFDAYFQQGILDSQEEHSQKRCVKIVYYLENDTIGIIEPLANNSRYGQSKLVKRHKIPKIDGEFYHWKDLNVGIDLEIYGVVYHVADCDAFTREFLTSQGIDVGESEELPRDEYSERKNNNHLLCIPTYAKSAPTEHKLLKFLEYDNMTLNFKAIWNDDFFNVRYHLADDALSITEVRKPNDGKDMGKTFLKKTKVSKNWKDMPSTYLDTEVQEFYSPQDLKVGETIFVFGRKILLCECDEFTKNYYERVYRITQPEKLPLQNVQLEKSFKTKTQQNDQPDRLERVRMVISKLYNFNKKLRYSLVMKSTHPDDEDREFIMEYHLADGKIRLSEKCTKNSGRRGGCFLNWNRIPKPNESDGPTSYYHPKDFRVGATLNFFGHNFVITGTEPYVYNYLKENQKDFPEELLDNIRACLEEKGMIKKSEELPEEKIEEENPNNDALSEENEDEKLSAHVGSDADV